MQDVGPLGAGERLAGELERAVAIAEHQRRQRSGPAPLAVAEEPDGPLADIADGQRRLERLSRLVLRQAELGERVQAEHILDVLRFIQRPVLVEHVLCLVELAALDQAQRVVRGRRASELLPAVSARVARQLEIGERVRDPPLPQQRQSADVAGGGERERPGAPARLLERGLGDLERALELAVQQKGRGDEPPPDPLRVGFREHPAAIPRPLGQLDRVVRRLARRRGVQRGVGEQQPLPLGSRALDRVLDHPRGPLERERLEVRDDRRRRDVARLELVVELELVGVLGRGGQLPERGVVRAGRLFVPRQRIERATELEPELRAPAGIRRRRGRLRRGGRRPPARPSVASAAPSSASTSGRSSAVGGSASARSR